MLLDVVCPADSPAPKASGTQVDCNDNHPQLPKRLIEILKALVLSKANIEREYCPEHFLTPQSSAAKHRHGADIRSKDCCRNRLAIVAHLTLRISGKKVNSGIPVYTDLEIKHRPSPNSLFEQQRAHV